MKKVFSLILMGLIGILFTGIEGVKALENDTIVTKTYIDNVWSFHYRDGKVWTYGNLPYNYANGKLVYCIQPDSRINTEVYSSYDDFSVSGYSEDARKQMELISYYGYGFKNHNSLKYYMATQELIWLLSKDEKIKWTVGSTSDTEEINIESEKNEINRLISLHEKLPSFDGRTITLNVNSAGVVEDSNDVLENYNITFDEGIRVINNGNKLTISADKLGEYNIYFTPIENYSEKTIVYDNPDIRTQDLATFGKPELKSGQMKVIIDKVRVKINKKDVDTNELILKSGNKVKINGEEYEFKNGVINLALPVGKYEIEEISASDEYYINKNKVEFEINNNDTFREIDFYNEKSKGKIFINKTNESNENLNDVKFEVYDSENNIVDTIITGGKNESKVLPLGKYYIKEISTLNGYEKDNQIYEIELNYSGENESIVSKTLNVINKKIKCDIVLISTDSNENNMDVYFDVYNDKNEIIYSGKTINGQASLKLEYGSYYIRETKVPNGYKLNDEIINFTVSDDFCNAKLRLITEKVVMPVTSTTRDLCYSFIFVINIIGWTFVKKYN